MKLEIARKFPFVFRADATYAETMPADQREGIFRVLDSMQRLRPEWLPLLRVEGWRDLLCIYDFRSEQFAKYAGMELVLLDDERIAYHRLPGALPDGAGHVAPGEYRFRLRPFGGARCLYIRVRKSDRGTIDEIDVVNGGTDSASFVDLPGRAFAYSRFAPELFALQGEWIRRFGSAEATRKGSGGTVVVS